VHPGSHRLEVLTPERLDLSVDRFDMRAYEEILEGMLRDAAMPAVELPVRAGDAVVWAANLAHGGATVRRTGSTRWSQVTHYVREGSLVVTPMRSVPSRSEYVVRDPLTDLRVGAARRYLAAPGGLSVLHRPGRRSLLVEPGRRVARRARLVSDAVLAARRIRAGAVAQLHGRRRPTPG
jgi:hypothetical protein